MSQAPGAHRYTLREYYLDVEEVSVVRHELIDVKSWRWPAAPRACCTPSAISALLGGSFGVNRVGSYADGSHITRSETACGHVSRR